MREPVTVRIDESDAKSRFRCGSHALDDFLARHALKNDKVGVGRTYVLRGEPPEPRVLGFYTLSMAQVAPTAAAAHVTHGLPRYPVPVALIGRLAVHERAQGRGLGGLLLVDALVRVVGAADVLGCIGIIVDAKDAGARAFYERHDFVAVTEGDRWPVRMFMPIQLARDALTTSR